MHETKALMHISSSLSTCIQYKKRSCKTDIFVHLNNSLQLTIEIIISLCNPYSQPLFRNFFNAAVTAEPRCQPIVNPFSKFFQRRARPQHQSQAYRHSIFQTNTASPMASEMAQNWHGLRWWHVKQKRLYWYCPKLELREERHFWSWLLWRWRFALSFFLCGGTHEFNQ